jgi:methylmalonyl-CoA/ethylmalonyl-CoA epimerase
MIEKLDHLGLIVKNMEAVLKTFQDCFEVSVEHVEQRPYGVKTIFLPIGETHIELIEVTDPALAHARTGMDVTMEGLHHIALKVTNINEVLERLKKQGVELIHEEPFDGSRNSKIAFVANSEATNTLLELVERSD